MNACLLGEGGRWGGGWGGGRSATLFNSQKKGSELCGPNCLPPQPGPQVLQGYQEELDQTALHM